MIQTTTNEFTNTQELMFFVQIVRIGRKMNIDMTQLLPHELMPAVARETSTDVLIDMIAGYNQSASGPVQKMIGFMKEELKTRGVMEK